MKRLFDSCRRQRHDLALLAAGVLSAAERAKVERHLAVCPRCQTYFTEIKSVASALSSSGRAEVEIQPTAAAIFRWETAIRSTETAALLRQTKSVENQTPWWRETIWPWRRAWIGVGCAWLVLLCFHHLAEDEGAPRSVATYAPVLASFREEQKILNELLADRSPAPDADRPKFSPKPRTERDQVGLA